MRRSTVLGLPLQLVLHCVCVCLSVACLCLWFQTSVLSVEAGLMSKSLNFVSALSVTKFMIIMASFKGNGKEATVNRALDGSLYPG
jgi:hypothetical protein